MSEETKTEPRVSSIEEDWRQKKMEMQANAQNNQNRTSV